MSLNMSQTRRLPPRNCSWNLCTSCTLKKQFIPNCVDCQNVEAMVDAIRDYNNKKDVQEFLTSIDLTCYKLYFDVFIEESFDRLENIEVIEMEDLEFMNVRIEWRHKILKAVEKLKKSRKE